MSPRAQTQMGTVEILLTKNYASRVCFLSLSSSLVGSNSWAPMFVVYFLRQYAGISHSTRESSRVYINAI